MLKLYIGFREERYVIKDLRQIDYEFETEALADFKYQVGSHTNRTSQENLTHRVEQLYLKEAEVPQLSVEEAMAFIQPKMFTKGRNMYS